MSIGLRKHSCRKRNTYSSVCVPDFIFSYFPLRLRPLGHCVPRPPPSAVSLVSLYSVASSLKATLERPHRSCKHVLYDRLVVTKLDFEKKKTIFLLPRIDNKRQIPSFYSLGVVLSFFLYLSLTHTRARILCISPQLSHSCSFHLSRTSLSSSFLCSCTRTHSLTHRHTRTSHLPESWFEDVVALEGQEGFVVNHKKTLKNEI